MAYNCFPQRIKNCSRLSNKQRELLKLFVIRNNYYFYIAGDKMEI